MDETVPIVASLDSLYEPEVVKIQEERLSRLYTKFSELYPSQEPEFVARSPGRVNLIGEHIDYSLYEVLPMAIAADCLVAVATSSPKAGSPASISVADIEGTKYKSAQFEASADGSVEIDASTHEWTNYFKAGLKGAGPLLQERDTALSMKNMHVLVDGTVPAGGGLSSSASFVCASALAVLYAHGMKKVLKKQLVELAIVSERSVGVNSGGMDQAASVFSKRGDALSVSFSPSLHAEPIKFPKLEPGITFMIAQSFVVSDKHVTAPECYNLRVVECTLAAQYIASELRFRLDNDSSPLGHSLRGLQNVYFDSKPNLPASTAPSEMGMLEEMLTVVDKYLSNEDGYTREELASIMKLSIDDLNSKYMTKFPVRAEKFHLRQRAQHVLTEAIRVAKFKALLTDPAEEATSLLQDLGDLMNKTQDSCRDVYQCSCPELDELCSIARKAGSYGSRLTGAGWGGCTVHLVPKDRVNEIKEAWIENYYKKRVPDLSDQELEEAIIVSEPGHGSFMFVPFTTKYKTSIDIVPVLTTIIPEIHQRSKDPVRIRHICDSSIITR
ncbi:galactokinase [Agyrium rufum]|nr:galactokinase [Agyrium rufum]